MLTPNYYCYILLELSIKLMRYESIYAVKCGNVVCHRFQTEMLGSLPCTSVYRKAAERNMEGECQKWNYHGNHRTWGHGSYSQENTNDAGLATCNAWKAPCRRAKQAQHWIPVDDKRHQNFTWREYIWRDIGHMNMTLNEVCLEAIRLSHVR